MEHCGLSGSEVSLEHVLHLKTGVNYLENNTFLAAGEFAEKEEFKDANLMDGGLSCLSFLFL